MQIVFLGTSCMVPTKERNHSAIFVSYGSEGILMDCGEGTQRQLKIADINPNSVTKILISHWHGDHVLGLPGLIQTLGSNEYNKTLEIYGPKGTKGFMENMFKAFLFDVKIEIKVKEVDEGLFFENNEFKLESLPLEHGIETVGFNFIEKDRRRIDVPYVKKIGVPEGPLLGQLQNNKSISWKGKTVTPKEATYIVKGIKVTYISDTVYCKNCITLAKDSDLLICEAAYSSKLEDKANEYKHMTSKQAALIANRANVKKLVLTHFSQRYKTTEEIEEDAKGVFENVICAHDFMKIKL